MAADLRLVRGGPFSLRERFQRSGANIYKSGKEEGERERGKRLVHLDYGLYPRKASRRELSGDVKRRINKFGKILPSAVRGLKTQARP